MARDAQRRGVIRRVLFRAVLLLGMVSGGGVLGQDGPGPAGLEPELDVRRDATVDAVARVMPAVVNVATRTWVGGRARDPFEQRIEEFFGHRQSPRAAYSRGSGVVVDPEGYVLTNQHVVGDADDISVQFADTEESLPAERVALSAGKDVALLKIRAPAGRRFPAVAFARDGDLLLGETVLALGNPFGLGGSVSRGILSAKTRRAPDAEPAGGRLELADWLQTDAAINPGNSGGPLVNLRGELIGINVAVMRPDAGAQGIGFAVPVQRINEALAEILSGESVGGLWFGARMRPGRPALTVGEVQPGSPAAAAGLKAGDEVREVDGRPVDGLIDFNRRLLDAGAERELRLGVRREGRDRRLVLRLTEETAFFNAGLVRERLGALVREARGGLEVMSVEPGSGAHRAGLRPGMWLLACDGQPVGDVVSLAKRIHARAVRDPVRLDVVFQQGWIRYRGGIEVNLR